MTSADAGARFRRLHEGGCFVIPNRWDRGTAIALVSCGFQALATTSAGFAFSQGLADTPTSLTLDAALGHVAEIAEATDLPVNADFQAGYADDPDQLAQNISRCVGTGVAGLSIEDALGTGDDPVVPSSERSNESASLGRRSTHWAPMCYRQRERNAISTATPIRSPRRSIGCRPTRRQAPMWSSCPPHGASPTTATSPDWRRRPPSTSSTDCSKARTHTAGFAPCGGRSC